MARVTEQNLSPFRSLEGRAVFLSLSLQMPERARGLTDISGNKDKNEEELANMNSAESSELNQQTGRAWAETSGSSVHCHMISLLQAEPWVSRLP